MVYDRWMQELSQMRSLPLPFRIHFLVAAWMPPCSGEGDSVTFRPGEMRELLTTTDPKTGEVFEVSAPSLSKALAEARRLGLLVAGSTTREAAISAQAIRPCIFPLEPEKPKGKHKAHLQSVG